MELRQTYQHNGKDAFSVHYICEKLGKGLYNHELTTTLPEQCLDHVHHNFFMRMTEDYRPTTTEVCKMLDKLSQEILKVEQFQPFYFPDYLLINGLIEEQLENFFHAQKRITLAPGTHYCASTRSLEFSILTKEMYRFRVFNKKEFERRFIQTTRCNFEGFLGPGRMSLDYIELYNQKNKFFILQQDSSTYFFLCDIDKKPQMIIVNTIKNRNAGKKN